MDKIAARIFPHNLDAERAVIGCILIENDVMRRVLDAGLDAKHFYREAHRKTFVHMLGLYQASDPVDLITVTESLSVGKQLEEIGGMAYLSSLPDAVPVTTNAVNYARIIVAKWLERDALEGLSDLQEQSLTDGIPADEMATRLRRLADRVEPAPKGSSLIDAGSAVEGYYAEQQRRQEDKAGAYEIKTGWPSLDSLLGGGWRAGRRPYVIAARPKVGKTSVALQTALTAATKHKLNVVYFSLELDRWQLVSRSLACLSGIDHVRIEKWVGLRDEEYKAIDAAAKTLHEAGDRLHFDCAAMVDRPNGGRPQRIPPTMTIREMHRTMDRLQQERDIHVKVIDYVQRIKSPGKTIFDQVRYASNGIADLAAEFGGVWLEVAQVGRSGAAKNATRPTSDDLKGAGDLEQDCEAVILLDRPPLRHLGTDEWTHMSEIERAQARMIVDINASGSTGEISMLCLGSRYRWEEVDSTHESSGTPRSSLYSDHEIHGMGHDEEER